jgi:hypothetical protein
MASESERIKQVVWAALVDRAYPGMGNPPTEVWNLYTPEGVAIVIAKALVKARPWNAGEEGGEKDLMAALEHSLGIGRHGEVDCGHWNCVLCTPLRGEEGGNRE